MKRVMIDSGSSTNVLFQESLKKMGKIEKNLKNVKFPLMGFALTTTYSVGAITLRVQLGKGWKVLTINITFIVVDALSFLQHHLGCTTLNPHRMFCSTYHQMKNLSTSHGIRVVKGDHTV